MTKSYKVRGGIEDVSGGSSTASSVKQAAKEVKDLGTVDASFSRGQLYLLDNEVVFSQSINESTIKNMLDNIFSKGPINPLRALNIYNPYEAPLADADENNGSWRLPYNDIEAISLLSKGNGYEIFLRPTGDPGHLYRIRNDQGTDYIGFRWLHSPNHDTAVQMASELFTGASRFGPVKEFDAGSHFPSRTKQVEFPKEESNDARPDRVKKPTTDTPNTETTDQPTPDTERQETNSAASPDQSDPELSQPESTTVDSNDSAGSNKIGGGKILGLGLLVFLVAGPLTAVIVQSVLVSSVLWGLGLLLSLFGIGRLTRGFLGN